MSKVVDKKPIKTGGRLNPFRLDDCIEQFNRGNWPGYQDVQLDLFLRLLKGWLLELREQREREHILACQIGVLQREIRDLEYTLEVHKIKKEV